MHIVILIHLLYPKKTSEIPYLSGGRTNICYNAHAQFFGGGRTNICCNTHAHFFLGGRTNVCNYTHAQLFDTSRGHTSHYYKDTKVVSVIISWQSIKTAVNHTVKPDVLYKIGKMLTTKANHIAKLNSNLIFDLALLFRPPTNPPTYPSSHP